MFIDFLFILVGIVTVFALVGAYMRNQRDIRAYDKEIRRPREKMGKVKSTFR